jgi:hypothetical protein
MCPASLACSGKSIFMTSTSAKGVPFSTCAPSSTKSLVSLPG